MKINLYPRFGCEWHVRWLEAFRDGLKAHGLNSKIMSTNQYEDCDIAVCWGLSHNWIAQHRAEGKAVLVLERGYIGDREEWTAIGWNGINGNADFCLDKPLGNRAQRLGLMVKDWQRNSAGVVLIAGQVPGDNSVRHIKLDIVYRQTIQRINLETHRKVVFRCHPLSRTGYWRKVLNVEVSTLPLDEDLARTFVVVTLNSNFGVDAIMQGVPVIALDKGSVVWDVAGHDLTDTIFPHYPDRTQWLTDMAYRQWNEDEIRNGYAWEHLKDGSSARAAA